MKIILIELCIYSKHTWFPKFWNIVQLKNFIRIRPILMIFCIRFSYFSAFIQPSAGNVRIMTHLLKIDLTTFSPQIHQVSIIFFPARILGTWNRKNTRTLGGSRNNIGECYCWLVYVTLQTYAPTQYLDRYRIQKYVILDDEKLPTS